MKLPHLATLVVTLMTLCQACTGDRNSWHSSQGAVWNTTFNIQYRGPQALDDSIAQMMRRVEMSLSPFNPRSAISLINTNESNRADSLIARVTSISHRVHRASAGAFDPTLSPLINLWGFGYERHDSTPGEEAIVAALQSVGIDSCHVEQGIMTKKRSSTTFNFSAVTKGLGCDLIGEMLQRNGCTDYLVEIGGEIAARGLNDRSQPWRVQVDSPLHEGHSRLATINLTTPCGVATSGNYRNYRDTSHGRVGHTISPVTGHPIITNTLSATVIAPDCATADALATACMAMPSRDALAMIEAWPRAECLLVVLSSDTLAITQTSGFPPIQ